MESEDKRKIHHPTGNENHGVHVCQKCGWAFPNPHPSAKHRRAHKKVCGMIKGFGIAGSEEKSHSDSDSDEVHKPSESIAQGSGGKVSEVVAESTSRSEEEVFVDAVVEFADAESRHTEEGVVISDTIPQTNGSTHDDQMQNLLGLEAKPDQLDSDIPLQGHALHFIPDATVASTSAKEINTSEEPTQLSSSDNFLLSSAPPLDPAEPTNDYMENPNISCGEDVNSVAVVGPDTDAGGNGESTEDKILSATAILPATEREVSSDFTNISTITMRDDSFKDRVMDLNVPDSTIFHAHEEQANVSGQQKLLSEVSTSMQPGPVDVEAGVSDDTHQVPKGSLHIDTDARGNVESTGDKILSAPAILPATEVEVSSDFTNISNITNRDDSSKDRVMDLNIPDSTIFHAHEEQANVSGQQKPQSEASPSTQLVPVDVEAGVSDDTHQVPEGSLHIDTDAGGNGESTEDKILSATAILPATEVEVSSDFTDISTITMRDDSSKDKVMDLNVPELTIFHAHEEQANASEQQKLQSEASPSTQSGPVDVEAGVSDDAHQVPKGSLHIDSRVEVYETTAENLPTFSTLEDVAAGNRCEIKSDACKDHTPLKPEVTQTLTSVTEMESNSHCSGPVLEESQSASMSFKSGESADVFFTTVQVQEGNLLVDGPRRTGVDENLNEEGSQSLRISSSECAAKVIHSNGLGTHSDSTIAFTPDVVDMGSSEVHATPSHSEDNKPGLSLGGGERELHGGFSNEILPEAPIAPVVGGSITGSAAATEVHQEIVKESGEYDAHEESGTVHTSIVTGYHEAGTEGENSLSSTQITPESAINVTEMNPQMYEDSGIIEVEDNLQLTEATQADIDSSSLENLSDNYSNRQNCHNEVYQGSSKEHAPDRFPDPSVVKTEKEPIKIGTESDLLEKLDPNSEVGLSQVDAQNATPEECMRLPESFAQSSFTPANSGNKDLTNGDASKTGDTILKQDASASVLIADASVDSSSQTDSMEGYWGSVSDGTVPSTRDVTDAIPILPTEVLPNIDVQTPKEVSVTNSKKRSPVNNSDIFEAPSFMTLVEPNKGENRQKSSAEIQSIQNPRRPSSPTSQTGWFPSLTNVVNESEGRKKNEEIIAKVVNWSAGKPHTPLRNLLVDANIEGKHKTSTTAQDHISSKTHEVPAPENEGVSAKTALEVSTVPTAKDATTNKEWDSPARLPVIKREKRKARAYWAQFVCCSSIN